jgi:hypothetical protein
VFLFLPNQIVAAAEKTIANDDVIAMVKAGLTDSAVIAAIGRSPNQFDLSPQALVKLRQAGVSNVVIEAMLNSQATGAATGNRVKGRAGELPSAYGYYVLDGGKLRALQAVTVDVVVGLRAGNIPGGPGWGVDGFKDEPNMTLNSAEPVFIVYQQNLNATAFRFSELQFVSSLQAGQFNVHGTRPEFFPGVFGGVRPNDTVMVNLWRPKAADQVRVEPIEGKSGMFRLIPNSPLLAGRYALWFGNSLHPVSMIFATDGSRNSSAFYMSVGVPSKTIGDQAIGGQPETRSGQGGPSRGSSSVQSTAQLASLIQDGRREYQAKNWRAAEGAYLRVLNQDPENFEATAQLGSIYIPLGELEKSKLYGQKAMNLRPDDHRPYYNMACTYAKMGDTERAITLLKQAIAKGFKDFEFMRNDPGLELIRHDPRFKSLSEKQ